MRLSLQCGLLCLAAAAASCKTRGVNDATQKAFDESPASVSKADFEALKSTINANLNDQGVPRAVWIGPKDIATLGIGAPGGKAHINSLLAIMAGGEEKLDAFVKAWLNDWAKGNVSKVVDEDGKVVNANIMKGKLTPRKGVEKLLADWDSDKDGKITLKDDPPVKLVAVVNRTDLWNPAPGVTDPSQFSKNLDTDAGETRFIYGADFGGIAKATIIFEYRNPTKGKNKKDLKGWAAKWLAVTGTPDAKSYVQANVESLIDDVTSEPLEDSMIRGQIRTNEFVLGGGNNEPWNLREFKLRVDGGAPKLFHTNVKMAFHINPNQTFDKTSKLANFLADKMPGAKFPNSVYAADGQLVDGFLGFVGGEVFETISQFTIPPANFDEIDKGTADKIVAEALASLKSPPQDLNCLLTEGGLPPRLRQEAAALQTDQAKLKKLIAIGTEMANCSACHQGLRQRGVPLSSPFVQVDVDGEIAPFTKDSLIPERVDTMAAAMNPTDGNSIKYVATRSHCTDRGRPSIGQAQVQPQP